MTRESSVVQSLVELADTLVKDFDVIDLLTGLAARCVSVLGVSAAGVMLASPDGDLRLVASSSEAMRVLELFELQAREGPCLDAFRTGERVEHKTLRTGNGRWPRFTIVALEAGFESVFALPLRLRDMTVGALNLFSVKPTPMEEADVHVAQAFADLAAISVLQHRAANETQAVNEQLTQALTSRILIEQAKGVIFERAGVDMPEAFHLLRDYARRYNLRLTDVAHSVTVGDLDPGEWTREDLPSQSRWPQTHPGQGPGH